MKRPSLKFTFVAVLALIMVLVSSTLANFGLGFSVMHSLASGYIQNRLSLMTAKTWDGGGATNNWSDAANWSGDAVPTSGDTVVFDATSSKDAVIDVDISVFGLQLNAGYTGTVSQANGAALTIGGNDLVVNSGTFNGSDGTITVNSNGFGALTVNGGTFNGGSGDIRLTGDANADHFLRVLSGTFNSTSGTLFLDRGFQQDSGAVFNANSGTVTFFGGSNTTIQGSSAGTTFNNLNFSKDPGSDINLVGRANVVAGSLALNEGTISAGSVESRGALTIAPAFDGGTTTLILANGTGNRTFTFATGLSLPRVVVADPNVTINTSGTGTLTFPIQLELQQGTINQGSVDLAIGPRIGGGACLVQSGGTFNASGNKLTLTSDGFGTISQSGGTFNGGSGDITLTGNTNTNHDLSLTGGVFTSTSGTLAVSRSFRITGGTFNHNNGNIVFSGSTSPTIDLPAAGLDLSNVTFARDNGTSTFLSGKMITIGTLNLTDGGFTNNGTIEVRSGMSIASTFDGGGPNNLLIANGSGPRTFTLDTSLTLPFVTLNDPNVTLNTSGSGTLNFPLAFSLQQGVFNQGSVDLNFFPFVGGGACFSQSGGTFNGSGNTITFTSNGFGAFAQTGGTFNGGTGDITSTGDGNSNHDLSISGGTFRSTSGTLTIDRSFRFTGGTFNHNGGTVKFVGISGQTIDLPTSGATLNNVNFARDPGSGTFLFGKMITVGTLNLTEGGFNNFGILEAQGDVNIAATFDGGGPNAFTFSGSAVQTFTNNGAPNPPGIWTVNKTGGTVNLASNLDLSNGPGNSLNLTAGTITTGNFEVNAGTRTIVRTAGYVSGNLRRDFSTTGLKTYDVGTANSYAPVSVNVVAPISGTQGLTVGEFQGAHPNLNPGTSLGRFWTLVEHGAMTANLTFNYIDPLDIHGSETAYRVAQIDSNVNFSTDAQIPINRAANSFTISNVSDFKSYTLGQPSVAISPANATVQVQGTQSFTGSGGTTPYSFSMSANSSFGNVVPSSGLYTAGTLAGGQDQVKVTDSEGRIAFATINVTPAPASQLLFGAVGGSVNVNTPISPAPVVVIQDQFGNAITTASDLVTISIANNPGGGILSGTLTQNAVNGVATFSDLSINAFGNGYTLGASSGSLSPATSSGFNVLGPAQLAFINEQAQQPIVQNTAFSLQVEIRDQFGTRFTNATNPITLAIANNPAGGTLTGVTTVNASGGLADFSGLTIDAPGTGYTFTAASPSLTTATSNSYNIVSPFVVTNTTDGQPGSLRSAIIAANSAPGTQTISFNIGGPAPYGIVLSSSLPQITDTVIIDGTTQPGFAGTPVIEIDARNSSFGLFLAAQNSVVKGLSITRSTFGVFCSGSGNSLSGNWLGISPNGDVNGNVFGITAAGQNTTIGGPSVSDRNVIGGNVSAGIQMSGASSLIRNNYIGLNPAGTAAARNGDGILIVTNAHDNEIRDNVISGNFSFGVDAMAIAGDINNSIHNNIIGMDPSATVPIPNDMGIVLRDQIATARISQNRISRNTNGGISLSGGAPLLNDPKDPDVGSNDRQNFPVLSSAISTLGTTTVTGTLNSIPSSLFTIEYFANPVCSLTGIGQGETFIGARTIVTDSGGIASISEILPVATANGQFITATATDSQGRTSEFSRCQVVSLQHSITGRITDNGGLPLANMQVSIQSGSTTKFGLTDKNGVYRFTNQRDGQNYVVTPIKPGFTFTPPSRTYSNFNSDQVNQNFVGIQQKFLIKGQVKSLFSGVFTPFGGATITLSGAANLTTQSDVNGNYRFNNLLPGNYTVTATKTNYVFAPPSVDTTLSGNQKIDFTTQLNLPLTGRIVFTRSGAQLFGMNADGSDLVVLHAPNNIRSSISPDGRRIALSRNGQICLLNYDGSDINCLATSGSLQDQNPAWSPDGTHIAFTRGNNIAGTLFTIRDDGTGILPVSTEAASSSTWSPDGNKIAYSAGTGSAIKVVNSNGSNAGTPTQIATNGLFPDWSPDGTKILFVSGTTIVSMDPTGGNQVVVASNPGVTQVSKAAWSPDGLQFVFARIRLGVYEIVVANSDGGNQRIIFSDSTANDISQTPDWGSEPLNLTNPGSNVTVNSGATSVTFGSVANAGQTSVIPIPPTSAGTVPGGYSMGTFGAFEIATTSTVAPPITVCFTVPSTTPLAQFNQIAILHNESGTLVDRTASRDFATKQVCASVTSLSPFAIAEQIDTNLPSITALVQDPDGNPLSGVLVKLTGGEDRTATSDSDGLVTFPNLAANGNYNVQPTASGYLFSEYSEDLVGVSGETTVVFTGTQAAFQVAGRITDSGGTGISGVPVGLLSDGSQQTVTDASGNYAFAWLAADESFTVAPLDAANSYGPASQFTGALTGDMLNVNFVQNAPTAAGVAVAGRVVDVNGRPIPNVQVSLSGGRLRNPMTARTSPLGYYRFDDIEVGESYVIAVESKRYVFAAPTRLINLSDAVSDADFVGQLR